jgi:hypothetical protein
MSATEDERVDAAGEQGVEKWAKRGFHPRSARVTGFDELDNTRRWHRQYRDALGVTGDELGEPLSGHRAGGCQNANFAGFGESGGGFDGWFQPDDGYSNE